MTYDTSPRTTRVTCYRARTTRVCTKHGMYHIPSTPYSVTYRTYYRRRNYIHSSLKRKRDSYMELLSTNAMLTASWVSRRVRVRKHTRLSYSCIASQWLEHGSQRLTHESHLITNQEIPSSRGLSITYTSEKGTATRYVRLECGVHMLK